MKFSPILAALFLLTAAICLVPQSEPTVHASSCSGYSEPTVAKSCSGEARKTPVRSFLATQPVRKTFSVLKPKAKSCNGS